MEQLPGEPFMMNHSLKADSFLIPSLTRPREYDGQDVPEVLLNGNHQKIICGGKKIL